MLCASARTTYKSLGELRGPFTMPSRHFALSHGSTASMHSILNLAFYRKCGKLPMVSHRFRRIPEQARAVAKSFFAAFGGREGGERIGGTAPGPPVKGLAALCNPAFRQACIVTQKYV